MTPNFFQGTRLKKLGRFYRVPFKSIIRVQIKRALRLTFPLGVMFWKTKARLGAKKKFSRINDWKIGLSAVQDYSDQQILNLALIDRQTL